MEQVLQDGNFRAMSGFKGICNCCKTDRKPCKVVHCSAYMHASMHYCNPSTFADCSSQSCFDRSTALGLCAADEAVQACIGGIRVAFGVLQQALTPTTTNNSVNLRYSPLASCNVSASALCISKKHITRLSNTARSAALQAVASHPCGHLSVFAVFLK